MATDPLLSTVISSWRLAADLAGRPDEFVESLRRLGYDIGADAVLSAVPAADEITTLVPMVEEHATALSDGATLTELLAALEMLPAIRDVVDALAAADLSDLDDALDGIVIDILDMALHWPQMLLFDVIEYRSSWLVSLFELLGLAVRSRHVFEHAEDDGSGEIPDITTVERSSVVLDVSGLAAFVDDPEAHLRELLVGATGVDHRRVADALASALGSVVVVERGIASADYVSTYLGGIRGDDLGEVTTIRFQTPNAPTALRRIEIVVGPARPGNDPAVDATGLAVAFGGLDIDPSPVSVSDTVAVTIATPDLDVGTIIGSDGDVELIGTASGDLGVTLDVTPTAPWRLFGSDTGPRLELGGLSGGVGYSVQDGDIAATIGLTEVSIEMGSEGADSFLSNLVAGVGASVDLALTISGSGVSFDANGQLAIRLPMNLTIGPIELLTIDVEIDPSGGELDIAVTTDVEVMIGPIAASASGVGVSGTLRSGDDADGFGLDVGLRLPHAVAFSFEGSEIISGGGFLDIDVDAGRYSGGVSLTILNVGVSALTVIDTQLPDDPDGWAFFLTLGIDIPGIPLGFGFTLEGLGGLIALNRSVDADALAAGLREGAVDAILFPDDPVRDAAVLIPQIDEYLPLLSGNTVIGPVVEIGWGAPVALITGQIGVMVSLPQGLIVIMGSLSTALPTPEAPLIEINMDALGVIDLANGTVLVTASLYDSRLLGVIELSGDMAFYLATSPSPYFALSVGGWHPAFQPPATLPSVFTGLRRLRAEISVADNVSITFETYFALTPNTVQFGGRFEAVATVRFLLVDYTAIGWFDFDVLLVFNPFKLVADVSAGVAVYAGRKELFGVDLGVHVEGPEPWFASGYARFKFFGVKVKFDFSVGGRAAPEIAPISDLLDLIEEQLATPDAWSAIEATGVATGLQLRSSDEELLLPDSRLVVQQTIAPLDRTIEKFGTNRSEQESLTLTSTRIEDGITGTEIVSSTEPVNGWFAPSQFEEMGDTARLAAASYEEMEAGVSFGIDGVEVPDSIDMASGHETKVWTKPIGPNPAALRELGTVTRTTTAIDDWYSLGPRTARATGTISATATTLDLAAVEYHAAAGQHVPTHVRVPT